MIVAFDYSLSCPCMCISTGPGWNNARFWFLTSVKKMATTFISDKIIGTLHIKDFVNDQERYSNISNNFISVMNTLNVPKNTSVYIEDYSFGSTGKVFGIAENTAIIKHKLWDRGNDIMTIPPTVIKKFASGKGNSDKDAMYAAFVIKTGIPLATAMGCNSNKIGSPVSDIVDAFYIAEYGYAAMRDKL